MIELWWVGFMMSLGIWSVADRGDVEEWKCVLIIILMAFLSWFGVGVDIGFYMMSKKD